MNRWAFTLLICLLLILPVFGMGEASIQASGDHFTVGDVVDLEVAGVKDASCVYTVWLDGQQVFNGKEPDQHLRVSYRPREAGEYEIRAQVVSKGGEEQTLSAAFTVEDGETAPEEVYSQRDGWWKDKSYRKSNLDAAGCAIFTLAHALQRMGIEDEAATPEALGINHALCLVENGTSNVRLIREASEEFVFQTQAELLENKNEIIREFRDGAMFSFSIVLGHIALASGLSDDAKKVEIVDSAPGVTLERLKKGSMYYLDENGKYVKIQDLADVPGARYYLESKQWGGLRYYMDLSYVAGRGVRLIKPYWLMLNEDGESIPVELETFGTVQSEITDNKKSRVVSTSDLTWRKTTQVPMAAYISGTKAVPMTDSMGKKIRNIPGRTVLPVIGMTEDKVQIRYEDEAGYVALKSVEVIDLSTVSGKPGVLSLKGSTSGRAEIRVRLKPGGKLMDNIATGTPVTVLSEGDDAYEIEVGGRRGYVQKEYVTLTEEQSEETEEE